MKPSRSLFDRLIAAPRLPWAGPVAVLLLLAVPMAVALGQGSMSLILNWRGLLISPGVMLYILLVVPPMSRMGDRVQESLRAVSLLEEARFTELARNATAVPLRNELAAIGCGALVGLSSAIPLAASFSWQGFYWCITSVLFYGLLSWIVYMSLVGTRLTRAIFQQPLKVDPLDLTPFEAFGRQSLLLAMVFVGGVTISLLATVFEPGVLQRIEFWLLYLILLCIPVTVFFLNMYPIHRVLGGAKAKELKAVRGRLHASFRELAQRLETKRDPGGLAETVNALAVYEACLREARTWPYNTAILRTLFASVLIPGGTLLARVILGMDLN